MKENSHSAWLIALGGFLSLLLAMGVGRFAYTPLLPLMQQESGFGADIAGGLAAINYAGYLLGALLCMLPAAALHRRQIFGLSLLTSVLTTAAMGLFANMAIWSLLRFLSGLASAGVLVLGSALVLDGLAHRGAGRLSGLLFSGVGAGIALSGLFVLLLAPHLASSALWLGLGLFCVPLAWLAWHWLADTAPAAGTIRRSPPPFVMPPFLPWLTAAYFAGGLGYIVTGTFIVAIVQESSGNSAAALFTWILVGLAAAVSTMAWPLLALRLGELPALLLAYALQAFGILLPVLSANLFAAYAGALLFGGTFTSIVTIAMGIGRRLSPQHSALVLGLLTTAYGSGQMLGPWLAGLVAAETGSFRLPLLVAALVGTAGAITLLAGARYTALRHNLRYDEAPGV